MRNGEIREAQIARLEKFPKDRIPFYRSNYAATEDQRNMRRYIHKEIGIETLCKLVEKANSLPEKSISPETMINELRITGWLREEE